MSPSGVSLRAAAWYTAHLQFVRDIGTGCGWILIGTVAGQVGTLIATVIAARLLGRTEFGAYGAVQATAITLANIATAGLGISATYYLAQNSRTDPQRAGRIAGLIALMTLVTATSISACLGMFAPALSTLLSDGPQMTAPLRWGAVYVFFATLSGYQVGALIGLGAYQAIAWGGLVQAFALPAAMYALTTNFGLSGAILAIGGMGFALWFIQCILLRSEFRKQGIRPTYSELFTEGPVFFRFALPAACSGVCGNLGIWASAAILLRSSEGMSQFALFAAANSLRNVVIFVPAIVNKVAVPVFTRMHKDSPGGIRQSFWSNVQLNAAFAVFAGAVMAMCGKPLLGLFGKHFSVSAAFYLLIGAACLEVTAVSLFQALLRRGAIWTQAGIMILWSGILIAVTGSLVNRLGGIALALGYFIAWGVCAGIHGWFALRFFVQKSAPGASELVGGRNPAEYQQA